MEETKAIDYVTAGVAATLFDISWRFRRYIEFDQLDHKFAQLHEISLPLRALEAALQELEREKLIEIVQAQYAPRYIRPVEDFELKMARWRFDKAKPASVLYDSFMNGPPDWLNRTYSTSQFAADLRAQLDASEPKSLDAADRSAVVDEPMRERLLVGLAQVSTEISRAEATNEEKAQAQALIEAIKVLASAPNPPKHLILDMLAILANIATIAAFVAPLINLLFGK